MIPGFEFISTANVRCKQSYINWLCMLRRSCHLFENLFFIYDICMNIILAIVVWNLISMKHNYLMNQRQQLFELVCNSYRLCPRNLPPLFSNIVLISLYVCA